MIALADDRALAVERERGYGLALIVEHVEVRCLARVWCLSRRAARHGAVASGDGRALRMGGHGRRGGAIDGGRRGRFADAREDLFFLFLGGAGVVIISGDEERDILSIVVIWHGISLEQRWRARDPDVARVFFDGRVRWRKGHVVVRHGKSCVWSGTRRTTRDVMGSRSL